MSARSKRRDRTAPVVFAEPVGLLVRAVRTYAAHAQVEPRTVCNRATESSHYWTRLRFGKVTIQTMEGLVRYLAAHWPAEGPPWPEGLLRP